jgi:hypothetical protein
MEYDQGFFVEHGDGAADFKPIAHLYEARVHALAVFEHYRATMARLRAAFPQVQFIHVTVPLTELQTGPKAAIKRLLLQPPAGYGDNLRREQFNELMRREYKNRESIFDLGQLAQEEPEQAASHR